MPIFATRGHIEEKVVQFASCIWEVRRAVPGCQLTYRLISPPRPPDWSHMAHLPSFQSRIRIFLMQGVKNTFTFRLFSFSFSHFETFTLTLLHSHLRTFTFTLLLSHFKFRTFTLSFSLTNHNFISIILLLTDSDFVTGSMLQDRQKITVGCVWEASK